VCTHNTQYEYQIGTLHLAGQLLADDDDDADLVHIYKLLRAENLNYAQPNDTPKPKVQERTQGKELFAGCVYLQSNSRLFPIFVLILASLAEPKLSYAQRLIQLCNLPTNHTQSCQARQGQS